MNNLQLSARKENKKKISGGGRNFRTFTPHNLKSHHKILMIINYGVFVISVKY